MDSRPQTRFAGQEQTMEEFGYSLDGELLFHCYVNRPLDEQNLESQGRNSCALHSDDDGRWRFAAPLGCEE